MKKILLTVLTLVLTVTLIACATPTTSHYEKDLYKAGEIIRVYDNETDSRLADLVITNVRILSDKPYTSYDFLCTTENFDDDMKEKHEGKTEIHGNKVYLIEEFNAILQIDYRGNSIDSHNRIKESNFKVFDCMGNNADTDVDVKYNSIETEDDFFVVGIKEIGELVIEFYFHESQRESCDIVCEYDTARSEYIIAEDTSEESFCSACNKLIDYEDKYCKYCGEEQ